jgi:hypothetical protein
VSIKSDDVDAKDESAADAEQSSSADAPTPGQPTAAAPQVTLDESNLQPGYANFCRVSSTPEEMILDFGLNPNPYGNTNTTINVSHRIIVNHFTAKRLLTALSRALQRHEQAFGVLETDVRKRVRET